MVPAGRAHRVYRRVWVADIVPDGHTQIYTMNADGSAITQITFTPDPPTAQFSGFPSWGKWSADSIRQ